jgi:hypothetical protein
MFKLGSGKPRHRTRSVAGRILTAVTAGLAASLPLALILAAPASADLVSGDGYVDLATTSSVGSGVPYSSGQTINVTVAANPTLSAANLDSNGYTGTPNEQLEECSDYGGISANLPTSAAGNCDSVTLASGSGNADGSFTLDGFTILALPDKPTFNEPSSHTPVCGLAPYYCVLYVGPNANSINPKTNLWSAPFQVRSNSDDSGSNPGDGTPEVPFAIGLPLLGLAVGGGVLYLRRRRAHA